MHKTTILCQFGLFHHKLTTISPSILNHFWWELYQPTSPTSVSLTVGKVLHASFSVISKRNFKGTTRQFLNHFKEKLRLLDILVPDTDKIPETVRITFLQRAVQKNHDLRQIHVLDSVWRSKTGSKGKFTLEVYYDLLWNAAYQHDLNNAAGKRKDKLSFLNKLIHLMSQSMILEKTPYLIMMRMILPLAQSFNLLSILLNLQKPTKISIPSHLWGEFPGAAKKLVIQYNKKDNDFNPNPFGGNPKPKTTLGKPNPKPQQIHFHENDHPPENPHSEDSTQALVHECITDGRIDPSDIDMVMSAFIAKSGKSSQDSSKKIKVHQRYVFDPPITWLIGEPMDA